MPLVAVTAMARASSNERADALTDAQPAAGLRSNASEVSVSDLHLNCELTELVRTSATGDARAFERFYERTIHFAFAAARRIVGEAYADDVLAESYFQAWRDASRYDAARGNPIAWLVTIVRSRSLDRLRQESLRHGGLSGAPDFDFAALEDRTLPGPDSLIEHVQAKSALHVAMAELSANERWCLGLAYFRDLSHAEIAATTGLPLGTVKTLISRSQQKLRNVLSAHDARN
ncbi:MAG: sigma-70 family RNA polymerase sigma factor [Betaproteobacteria bacterium]|nr:MAG: sigma-70 family RNA polymerase sigma factor [Betaproteobacteria bacterium]